MPENIKTSEELKMNGINKTLKKAEGKIKIKTNLDLHACSSANCDSQGCDYCAECSHAEYYATREDKNKKMWYWFFNPRHGPTFCNPVGEKYKRQPHEKSEAWTVFEAWYKDNFKEITEYKKGIF